MVVEKGYKHTEVGVIPEDWKIETLVGITDKIIGGGTPSRTNAAFWGTEIPWVTVKDFATFDPYKTQEYITQSGLKNSSSNLIPQGILITSTRMALGKAVIYQREVAINQDLKALFFKKNYNVNYLYYWFQKNVRKIEDLGSGSTVMGISLVDLKQLILPLPPLPEQTAIANALSDMDALIAQTEKLIEKKKAIKQGVMQELLKSKEGWVTKKLGEICDIYQPQTISAEKFTNDGYLVYGANGIVGFYHSYNHKKWQVMITCRGSTCGTVNKSNEYSWITGNAMVMNVDSNKEIDKEFFYYLLSKQDFSNTITGSGQPQIVRSPLANFWIALPKDKNEQSMIGRTLSELDALIDKITIKLQKLKHQKQGMMQALLTGKIRLI